MPIRFAVDTESAILVDYPPYRFRENILCIASTGVELCSNRPGKELLANLGSALAPLADNDLNDIAGVQRTVDQFVTQYNLSSVVAQYAQKYYKKHITSCGEIQGIPHFSELMRQYFCQLGMVFGVLYENNGIKALDFSPSDYFNKSKDCANLYDDIRSLLKRHGALIAGGRFGAGYYPKKAEFVGDRFGGKPLYQHRAEYEMETRSKCSHSILVVGIQKLPSNKVMIYYLDPTYDKRFENNETKLRVISLEVFLKNSGNLLGLSSVTMQNEEDPNGIFNFKKGERAACCYPGYYLFAAQDYGALQAALAAGGDGYSVLADMRPCATCGKSTSQRCSGCHTVYYCSRECQKTHWPTHKHVCIVKPKA